MEPERQNIFTDIPITLKSVDAETTPGVPEFFKGCNLFVTGSSGFMGRVLLEKLLRSCPDIGTIYLLLREKKGSKPIDRLKVMTDVPLFDRLRLEQPNALDKLVAISGDVSQLRMGIMEQDEVTLKNEVSVVIHTAATVRFDDPIRKAVLLNTRGTRETVRLAKQMPNLKVFVHVSTMYCNADFSYIEEKMYKPRANYEEIIRLAESIEDDSLLHILQPKILGSLPNTYVFSKSLAEDIVNEMRNQFPVVIYRPSIVIPTYAEPMPGWIDNLNGPMGLVMGAIMGVIHTIHGNGDHIADWMPADLAINGIIAAAWYKGVSDFEPDKSLVINAATSPLKPVRYGDLTSDGVKEGLKIPMERTIWYPFCYICWFYPLHLIMVVLFHIIPALFIDTALAFRGDKFRLLTIYRKIFAVNKALIFFITREWTFQTSHFNSLQNVMNVKDRYTFSVNFLHFDPKYEMHEAINGLKKYILKEDPKTQPKSKVHLNRLFWLHNTIWVLIVGYFFYLSLQYYSIVTGKLRDVIQAV